MAAFLWLQIIFDQVNTARQILSGILKRQNKISWRSRGGMVCDLSFFIIFISEKKTLNIFYLHSTISLYHFS